jgi:flavin-dependent dehydrogenase
MNSYDVIVIGAGPAGCSAAISCARHGLKVAIVERLLFPRHRPGETLHPGMELLLQQLGVFEKVLEASVIRPRGSWIKWERERHFVPFGEDTTGAWMGFQIPRSTLDSILLERAAASGVHILHPCHAKKVLLKNNRVVGIQTPAEQLFCRQLVDASGPHAWLARQLGLTARRYSPPLTALYGYKRGDVEESALGIFTDRLGWYWTAHIGPQLYHWTRLYFLHDQVSRATAVPASLFELACTGKIQGADVTWRALDQSAGSGYFVVGDAANVLDPGTSHGVLKALMSGMMAARCIIDESAAPTNEHAISMHYNQWVKAWFESDVQKMRELYRRHPFPPHWLGAHRQ